MPAQVIDAHVHLFPPDVIACKDDYCQRDAWFGLTHAALAPDRFPPVEALLESMNEAGVDRAVIAAWPWRDPVVCRAHNDFLAEVCRLNSRLAWLGIVNPAEPGAAAEVERIRQLGGVGIGELNADAQGFAWEDERQLREVGEVATTLDMPVMAHVSEPVGHDYPGKGTATPPKILAFIERHPDLRFVAAHWGGGLPFYELMPEVGLALRNVTYDTAASTYLYRHQVFDIVTRIVGADRVVWGSDYPVLGQRRFLAKARAELPEAVAEAVLGGNAARLYGLRIPEVAS
jgi:predicted TIM-barrel fold metal-dependent hydrolase